MHYLQCEKENNCILSEKRGDNARRWIWLQRTYKYSRKEMTYGGQKQTDIKGYYRNSGTCCGTWMVNRLGEFSFWCVSRATSVVAAPRRSSVACALNSRLSSATQTHRNPVHAGNNGNSRNKKQPRPTCSAHALNTCTSVRSRRDSAKMTSPRLRP